MKSIQRLKQDYRITEKKLLEAMRNCISYYLGEEELKPFIIKELER